MKTISKALLVLFVAFHCCGFSSANHAVVIGNANEVPVLQRDEIISDSVASPDRKWHADVKRAKNFDSDFEKRIYLSNGKFRLLIGRSESEVDLKWVDTMVGCLLVVKEIEHHHESLFIIRPTCSGNALSYLLLYSSPGSYPLRENGCVAADISVSLISLSYDCMAELKIKYVFNDYSKPIIKQFTLPLVCCPPCQSVSPPRK